MTLISLGLKEKEQGGLVLGDGQPSFFSLGTQKGRKRQGYKCERDDGKDCYGFQFLEWTERQGMIQYEAHMNTVLTAIERAFLQLDPQTEVSTEYVNTKTKPKFF